MAEGGEPFLGARGRTPGPDTGGVDLGSWGNVGGSVPGMHTAIGLAADVSPVLLTAMMHRKAAKDYNDQPTSTTVGTSQGQKVDEQAPSDTSWMPAP